MWECIAVALEYVSIVLMGLALLILTVIFSNSSHIQRPDLVTIISLIITSIICCCSAQCMKMRYRRMQHKQHNIGHVPVILNIQDDKYYQL